MSRKASFAWPKEPCPACKRAVARPFGRELASHHCPHGNACSPYSACAGCGRTEEMAMANAVATTARRKLGPPPWTTLP